MADERKLRDSGITPAMIEAGVEVLERFMDGPSWELERAAEQVLQAALAGQPDKGQCGGD